MFYQTAMAVIALYVVLQSFLTPTQLPEIISLLVGALSSIIVQLVKKKFAAKTTRFFFSLVLSAAVGALSYYVAKPAETDVIVFITHVFAYSQLAYTAFWKVLWQEVFSLRDLGKVI